MSFLYSNYHIPSLCGMGMACIVVEVGRERGREEGKRNGKERKGNERKKGGGDI